MYRIILIEIIIFDLLIFLLFLKNLMIHHLFHSVNIRNFPAIDDFETMVTF